MQAMSCFRWFSRVCRNMFNLSKCSFITSISSVKFTSTIFSELYQSLSRFSSLINRNERLVILIVQLYFHIRFSRYHHKKTAPTFNPFKTQTQSFSLPDILSPIPTVSTMKSLVTPQPKKSSVENSSEMDLMDPKSRLNDGSKVLMESLIVEMRK